MMQSMGGSFGLAAGGQATDFVVLVMNNKGARALAKAAIPNRPHLGLALWLWPPHENE
jgi:hypothetical protein